MNTESKIETILFDLGGVLIDWNPRYLYKKIFSDPKEMEYFLRDVANMDWNERQDAGRPFEEAIDVLAEKYPEYQSQIQAYFYRWGEMLNGPIQGTVDILAELRTNKNQNLFALTNWSAETFPIARELYSFLGWFEGILVSGEENLKKPDPQIYALTLERFNLDATKTLFIDDSSRNVTAAIQSGIRAIQFESPEKLRMDLEQYGVLGQVE